VLSQLCRESRGIERTRTHSGLRDVEVRFRIEEVGVDEAREQHTKEELTCDFISFRVLGQRDRRGTLREFRQLSRGEAQRFIDARCHAILVAPFPKIVGRLQSAVMGDDRKLQRAAHCGAVLHPRTLVVDAGAARPGLAGLLRILVAPVEVVLEVGMELAEIVVEAGGVR